MKITIDKIAIELRPDQEAIARALIESFFLPREAPPESAAPVERDSEPKKSTVTPPLIGEYWEGQGGIYAGVSRATYAFDQDYHLILYPHNIWDKRTWQGALDCVGGMQKDGHKDFSLPTRFDCSLLQANLHDRLDSTEWCWTSTKATGNQVWCHDPSNGKQFKKITRDAFFRAVAVRRVPI